MCSRVKKCFMCHKHFKSADSNFPSVYFGFYSKESENKLQLLIKEVFGHFGAIHIILQENENFCTEKYCS